MPTDIFTYVVIYVKHKKLKCTKSYDIRVHLVDRQRDDDVGNTA